MATLVLTVVGGIVGGPVGAAIGAAIGQQVDAAIFRPKGREGPRLSDLRIQASTYGQPIPKLFGTIRVAGSVIWATDLIERRNRRGGGKGRPSTTEYSYAASFAIALSSRRALAIRRIWADGNLLRGASGSFQERCTFRWYGGSEDQAADPLIASAVGMTSTSAFRGLAYAVFEELDLTTFGNRIPSLTFEVEADAGSVDAGLVGNELLGEAGRCVGAWPFLGYAASGDRVREALAPLIEADGVRLASGPQGWRLAPPGGVASSLADFSEARRMRSEADRTEQRRAPLSALPGAIRLRHYEPERDYQLGQQMSAVAGGGLREDRIDLPAVLGAASARALVQALAAAAADGRETVAHRGDLAALALTVGGLVTLADGDRWRVAARRVQGTMATIELQRYQPVDVIAINADPGVPVTAPDWPDADVTVRAFDAPAADGTAAVAPRIVIAAAGSNDGWRGADLWFRAAAGTEPIAIGRARPAAALGALAEPLTAASAHLFDGSQSLLVALVNPSMTLESVEDSVLLGGANRAMVGGELVQFGSAEAVGEGLWRLSRLLRGRAGTEGAMAHDTGTPFVLLDDPALVALPDNLARLAEGGGAALQWASYADTAIGEIDIAPAGAALRPFAPVHGAVDSDGAGGVYVAWVRRSRFDTGWRDHVDLPLGEGSERWRVELTPPVAGIGPWELAEAVLHIGAAEMAGIAGGARLSIRQVGDFTLSPPLLLSLK